MDIISGALVLLGSFVSSDSKSRSYLRGEAGIHIVLFPEKRERSLIFMFGFFPVLSTDSNDLRRIKLSFRWRVCVSQPQLNQKVMEVAPSATQKLSKGSSGVTFYRKPVVNANNSFNAVSIKASTSCYRLRLQMPFSITYKSPWEIFRYFSRTCLMLK